MKMKFSKNKLSFIFSILVLIQLLVSEPVLAQEEEEEEVTEDPAEDGLVTTTALPTTTTTATTTTTTPRIPEALDYRFVNFVNGLTVDVNFTEVVEDASQTRLSMRMSTDSNSNLVTDFCRFGLKLLAVNQETCEGVGSGAALDIQEIATINKAGQFPGSFAIFCRTAALVTAIGSTHTKQLITARLVSCGTNTFKVFMLLSGFSLNFSLV